MDEEDDVDEDVDVDEHVDEHVDVDVVSSMLPTANTTPATTPPLGLTLILPSALELPEVDCEKVCVLMLAVFTLAVLLLTLPTLVLDDDDHDDDDDDDEKEEEDASREEADEVEVPGLRDLSRLPPREGLFLFLTDPLADEEGDDVEGGVLVDEDVLVGVDTRGEEEEDGFVDDDDGPSKDVAIEDECVESFLFDDGEDDWRALEGASIRRGLLMSSSSESSSSESSSR